MVGALQGRRPPGLLRHEEHLGLRRPHAARRAVLLRQEARVHARPGDARRVGAPHRPVPRPRRGAARAGHRQRVLALPRTRRDRTRPRPVGLRAHRAVGSAGRPPLHRRRHRLRNALPHPRARRQRRPRCRGLGAAHRRRRLRHRSRRAAFRGAGRPHVPVAGRDVLPLLGRLRAHGGLPAHRVRERRCPPVRQPRRHAPVLRHRAARHREAPPCGNADRDRAVPPRAVQAGVLLRQDRPRRHLRRASRVRRTPLPAARLPRSRRGGPPARREAGGSREAAGQAVFRHIRSSPIHHAERRDGGGRPRVRRPCPVPGAGPGVHHARVRPAARRQEAAHLGGHLAGGQPHQPGRVRRRPAPSRGGGAAGELPAAQALPPSEERCVPRSDGVRPRSARPPCGGLRLHAQTAGRRRGGASRLPRVLPRRAVQGRRAQPLVHALPGKLPGIGRRAVPGTRPAGRHAAPLPGGRAALDERVGRPRSRRHPGRRDGPGQVGAAHRVSAGTPERGARRRAQPHRVPRLPRVQLDGRVRALRPDPGRARCGGRQARAHAHPRRGVRERRTRKRACPRRALLRRADHLLRPAAHRRGGLHPARILLRST